MELLQVKTSRLTLDGPPPMAMALCLQPAALTGRTIQSVSNDNTGGKQVLVCPLRCRLFAKTFDSGQTHQDRITFLISGHSRYKGACQVRPGRACHPDVLRLIGIVLLYCSYQELTVIALLHHLHQLVFHTPYRIIGNAHLPH